MADRGDKTPARKTARSLPLTHRQHKATKRVQPETGATTSTASTAKTTTPSTPTTTPKAKHNNSKGAPKTGAQATTAARPTRAPSAAARRHRGAAAPVATPPAARGKPASDRRARNARNARTLHAQNWSYRSCRYNWNSN